MDDLKKERWRLERGFGGKRGGQSMDPIFVANLIHTPGIFGIFFLPSLWVNGMDEEWRRQNRARCREYDLNEALRTSFLYQSSLNSVCGGGLQLLDP